MRILFLCIGNACRSQMAEGFARKLGKGKIKVFSAGSKPMGIVSPVAIEVMKEVGVDISLQKSKGFSDLPVKDFDYVINMGCLPAGEAGGDACPLYPAKQKIDWKIEDPLGKSMDVFREVRDKIKNKVEEFLLTLAT